ncbi:MAG TPA: acyl-CoA dehydrogenase, partial [Nitrospinae bacterium]|nr:acyl-CoA dehydrogenase [Nitrospinota bacterium]
MNFELTEDQKLIKDTVRKFAEEEIVPVARENDIKEHFPIEIIKKMASLGFLGAPIPEKYGGAGLDFISDAIIFEEIGKADSSIRTTLSVQV